jgi:hypothetical protein
MLFYPAALPLSSQTLNYAAGVIRRHRRQIGSCWRKLNPGRQALLVLAYLAAFLRPGRRGRGWRPCSGRASSGYGNGWKRVRGPWMCTTWVPVVRAPQPWWLPMPGSQRWWLNALRSRRRCCPYRPGEFYLRELPPMRAVLHGLGGLSLLVVDGHADLDPRWPSRPGRAR